MDNHGRTAPVRLFAAGLLVAGSLAAGTVWAQVPVPARPSASTPLVLRGVTVIDVRDGRRLSDQQVTIVGNRIRTVADARGAKIPKGAHVVDARGKYVVPGLWDMHVHIYSDHHDIYPQLLAYGVTGFREAGGTAAAPLVTPLDSLRRWQRGILAGTDVGPPRQILSGLRIDQWAFTRTNAGPANAANVRQLIDSLVAAGADMIKVHDVDTATYVAIAAEARRLGVPFGGHASGETPGRWQDGIPEVTPLEASALGARLIDHELGGISCWDMGVEAGNPPHKEPVKVDLDACRKSVRQFRQNDTWFVPTSTWIGPRDSAKMRAVQEAFDTLQQAKVPLYGLPFRRLLQPIASPELSANVARPESLAVSPRPTDSHFADSLRVLDLVRHELPIVTGTDSYGPLVGSLLHMDMAELVRWGWSPSDVLRAATLNPAKALHATDSLGTVEAGKLADLVLLDADPLEDITNTAMINAVIADGRYFDRPALDGWMAKSKARKGKP